jgi:hypothetical protein
MHYLTEFSTEELEHNFELANEHLKQVFSKYPRPRDVEGCPHCVSEYDRQSLKQGNLDKYLWKAMTTWGGEDDFKHYIPQMFSFVFLEEEHGDGSILLSKLNYVENWIPEETQAIVAWFSAYFQYIYIGDLMRLIEQSRLKVKDWLEGRIQELSCRFPFDIFLIGDFSEMAPFLDSGLLEKFAHLLDLWPLNEIDFVVYASCLTEYQILFGYNNFFNKRMPTWITRNERMLEELFWKTEDHRLQQLFSDAISLSAFPLGSWI